MFGLLQCCIPITLKADILTALSSLAQNSPHEIVEGLEQWTESSQLLTNQYSWSFCCVLKILLKSKSMVFYILLASFANYASYLK